MNCPKHPTSKMTLLFTSYVCDVCDPPKTVGTPAATRLDSTPMGKFTFKRVDAAASLRGYFYTLVACSSCKSALDVGAASCCPYMKIPVNLYAEWNRLQDGDFYLNHGIIMRMTLHGPVIAFDPNNQPGPPQTGATP